MKPNKLPLWSTNGNPTHIIEPPTTDALGDKSDGFRGNTMPVPGFFNWLFHLIGKWIQHYDEMTIPRYEIFYEGITPFNNYSTNTFATPNTLGSIEIPNCKVGDVLRIEWFMGVQSTQVPAGDGNELRLLHTQAFGSGSQTSPAQVPGTLLFTNTTRTEMLNCHAYLNVTIDGTVKIEQQGRITGVGILRQAKIMRLTVYRLRY